MTSRAAIRTPDQRLRVFVSSTLAELAPERKAVRIAIERLRLAPVMFELGARPHPPADLYRAYLEQSDVFVGLYWERYGWIAPGEEVSGLEDEYLRAPVMPHLMYIKQPAEQREPRLAELLTRIRTEGTTSYKSFTTPEELGELLEADLAVLLAERFDRSRPLPGDTSDLKPSARQTAAPLPVALTELIGREHESAELRDLITRPSVRLVTLHGPGGIGKSRLAVDVVQSISQVRGTDVAFIDLAPVQDAELVPSAIAEALGVRDTGDDPLVAKLTTALRDRELVVVIDNFEQVLAAAPVLTVLLSNAPGLTLVVTSRAVLRVSGEHVFEVGPLTLPAEAASGRQAALDSAAVALFVERVRAVRPDFELTEDNYPDVVAICAALDGVPLALELAAARVRMLPPAAMRDRLVRTLPMLVGGVRDLPRRQQTLRNTIEWSTGLLEKSDELLLARLGVFAGGFSLEAVEAVADPASDVLTSLGTLVDNSLVRQQDHGDEPHFSMLATVREHARERLVAEGLLDELCTLHAAYYVDLGDRLEVPLEGGQQGRLVARLSDERDNLRAAVRFLLDRRDWSTATRLAWTLYLYWWLGGLLGEVRGWMEEVLGSDDPLPDLARATALYFRHAITFWQASDETIVPGLTESAELFHRAGERSGEALARISLALALLAAAVPDPNRADETLETSLRLFREADDTWGESMALVTLGRVAIFQQKVPRAVNRFEETLALTRKKHDEFGTVIALHHLGWAHLLRGEIPLARSDFEQSLSGSVRLRHDEGIAYGLEGLVAIAAASGDVRRAGALLGAAETIREQSGLYNSPTFSFHQQMVAPFSDGPDAAALEAARLEGRILSTPAAIALASPPAEAFEGVA